MAFLYCAIMALILGVGVESFWQMMETTFPPREVENDVHLRPDYIVREIDWND